MKQLWAVVLTALTLAGCRSSQPTTNPFMRTTVPPPGTQGMMVMPGEPYPVGTVPPVVTTPGAPAAVPVTPVPVQPAPVVAPPPPPKQEKFQPPGGSYLYHQSSNESPRAGAATAGVQMASAVTPTGAVQQAAHFEEQAARPTGKVAEQSSWQIRNRTADSRGDPPEKLASVTVGQETANSTVRILDGSAAAGSVQGTNSTRRQGVLYMTVGDSRSTTTRDARGVSSQPLASRVAIVTADTASPADVSVARGNRDLGAVKQAAFQPASNSGYAYAPDYRTLRGRLEYSQSLQRWKLRYIPINGQTDAFGGSVVLGDFPALASHKPGDMVAVRGMLAGGNTAHDGFSPRYELETIEPLSR